MLRNLLKRAFVDDWRKTLSGTLRMFAIILAIVLVGKALGFAAGRTYGVWPIVYMVTSALVFTVIRDERERRARDAKRNKRA